MLNRWFGSDYPKATILFSVIRKFKHRGIERLFLYGFTAANPRFLSANMRFITSTFPARRFRPGRTIACRILCNRGIFAASEDNLRRLAVMDMW